MIRTVYIYIIIVAALLLNGCGNNTKNNAASLAGLDTLYYPEYASRFEIYKYGDQGSTILNIKNPWQGAENINKYLFLSHNGEKAPEWLNAEVIPVPIKSAVCMSSSYIAFLDTLGADNIIKGVSGAGFIMTPSVTKRIDEGSVVDVGYDKGINYELLLTLKPDVIFIYGIAGENSAITDKLNELGLKYVYIGEYLEESPLGKAEWIIPIGEFIGQRKEAETIFENIKSEYIQVANMATQKTNNRPKVMLNSPWRDSWFVPGDRSYMVKLINDAGGEYVCKGNDSDQSRPISTETAFLKVSESDIWLNPGSAMSIKELITENPRFSNVPPVLNGKVFNNNKRTTLKGGSDFWESGTINPHIILKDMIRIIHPELLPDHELVYFHQLK